MIEHFGFKMSYALSIAIQLGFIMAASVAGFVLLGIWFDRVFGTSPFFLVSGVALSVILTLYEAYHMLLPLIKEDYDKEEKV